MTAPSSSIVACCCLALLVSCAASPTSIRVEVLYPEALGVRTFQIEIAHGAEVRTRTADATGELLLLVPDDWADTSVELTIRASGDGGESLAGATSVAPRLGQTVMATVRLRVGECTDECAEDVCEGMSRVACVVSSSTGCLEPAAPVLCPGGCEAGSCVGACEDECDPEVAQCLGGDQVRLCTQLDADPCWEWSPAMPCPGCADGVCEGCMGCVPGSVECTGLDAARTCVDPDSDGCGEWESTACDASQYCGSGSCRERDPIAITAGDSCTFVVRADGRGVFWGQDGSFGLRGDGPADNSTASPVSQGSDWIALSSSRDGLLEPHACGLAVTDPISGAREVRCWGSNARRQVRSAIDSVNYFPVSSNPVLSGEPIRVAAGSQFTCAASATEVRCWGENGLGQVGVPRTTEPQNATVVPFPSAATVEALSAGMNHACAIRDGELWCWGASGRGQLGHLPGGGIGPPTLVAPPTSAVPWSAVEAGSEVTCAILAGDVYCWGRNEEGQLGLGTADTMPHPTPARVELFGPATSLCAGRQVCAAVPGRGVYCWGDNALGQVDGVPAPTTPAVATPRLVIDEGGIAQPILGLACGATHTCAAVPGGFLCWGDNEHGQLGRGTTGPAMPPPLAAAALP